MLDGHGYAPWMREANLIGGDWVGADSGKTIDVTDKATGEVIGTIPGCGRAETARAIEAARAGAATRAAPLCGWVGGFWARRGRAGRRQELSVGAVGWGGAERGGAGGGVAPRRGRRRR